MNPKIGASVRDLVRGDTGTVVGMCGRAWEVEWVRPSPHPSYVEFPSEFFVIVEPVASLPAPKETQ